MNEYWGECIESLVRYLKLIVCGERNGKNGVGRFEVDDGFDDWWYKWVWKMGIVGGKDIFLFLIVMNYFYLYIYFVFSNWVCKRGYLIVVFLWWVKE